MTTAMAEQSWLTHSPKPRDTLPPSPSNLEGELLNLEGEQPLSQSLNSYNNLQCPMREVSTGLFFFSLKLPMR